MNSFFNKTPLVGILRGIDKQDIEPIVRASINAGLPAIEITMNTANAGKLIEIMAEYACPELLIGAGTVLTMKDLHEALGAGAQFIVTPIVVPEVIRHCANNNIPVFPGALTPTEIYTAWQHGATMVKVFPASAFGPAYFKEIKAPLDQIKLLACGGVSTQTIRAYFSNGASAVAFGGSIFRKEWIKSNRFDLITEEIQQLILAMNAKP